MAPNAVIDHQVIDPADQDDLETLLREHRHWRARLRDAIEDSKRLRTCSAAFRQHCQDSHLTKRRHS